MKIFVLWYRISKVPLKIALVPFRVLKLLPKAIFLFFIFIWLAHLPIYAQEDKKAGGLNIGEGMEIRKVRGFNLLVPKDARTWYDGGVLKVEDVSEYSASRFIKIEKYFEEIDKILVNLQKQIDELKRKPE